VDTWASVKPGKAVLSPTGLAARSGRASPAAQPGGCQGDTDCPISRGWTRMAPGMPGRCCVTEMRPQTWVTCVLLFVISKTQLPPESAKMRKLKVDQLFVSFFFLIQPRATGRIQLTPVFVRPSVSLQPANDRRFTFYSGGTWSHFVPAKTKVVPARPGPGRLSLLSHLCPRRGGRDQARLVGRRTVLTLGESELDAQLPDVTAIWIEQAGVPRTPAFRS
jgi:hypothetical protein